MSDFESPDEQGPRIIDVYDDVQRAGTWGIVRMPKDFQPEPGRIITPDDLFGMGKLLDSGLIFTRTAKVKLPDGSVHIVPIFAQDRPPNIPEDWRMEDDD